LKGVRIDAYFSGCKHGLVMNAIYINVKNNRLYPPPERKRTYAISVKQQ
jgi:hypothetical protein